MHNDRRQSTAGKNQKKEDEKMSYRKNKEKATKIVGQL